MPALGAAVIVDGKLVALGVDGIRKVGDDTLVTNGDLWHLGSCTKAMTATLLAKQVAAGTLKWDTTLGEALPELRDGMHEDARKITIARLLQHRSGLPSQPPMAQWLELFKFDGTDTEARREVAANMLKKAPEAALGERFLYSNAGYMIAGAALERATGKTWQQLIKAELFAPLGMDRAGFGAPGRDKHVDQPWGHVKAVRGSQPMFADNPSSLGPAGTVHATLEDWAKFVALHLGVVAKQGKPLLDAPLLAALHQPPNGANYALGWVTTKRDWAQGPVIWHNGSNTMWYAVTWMAPDAKFAVLVTCNHGGGQKACDEAAAACIRRFRR
jgi:CubicO group peptidase (beta-lactamase class C family)